MTTLLRLSGFALTLGTLLLGCHTLTPEPSPTGPLRAGSNMRHPPFSSWNESGVAVGIEVELVEAAAAALGREVTWIERPFAELLDAVASGELDVAVSTIGVTPARSKRVAFSQPYFETEIVALVRPGAGVGLADLARGRIGADRATTSHGAARAQWPNATLLGAVDEDSTWPRMVAGRRIDAFVVDASDQGRLEEESGVRLERVPEALKSEHFAVALSHGNKPLRLALDAAVRERISATPDPR